MMLKESIICFLCLLIKHIDTDQNAGLWLSALPAFFCFVQSVELLIGG